MLKKIIYFQEDLSNHLYSYCFAFNHALSINSQKYLEVCVQKHLIFLCLVLEVEEYIQDSRVTGRTRPLISSIFDWWGKAGREGV